MYSSIREPERKKITRSNEKDIKDIKEIVKFLSGHTLDFDYSNIGKKFDLEHSNFYMIAAAIIIHSKIDKPDDPSEFRKASKELIPELQSKYKSDHHCADVFISLDLFRYYDQLIR
uniref:Uncharacterized protein n=1 Tax=Pithovirus LCDPAC01 TaxID=2506600 RepID=A0A481YNI6_9VIRU|nr:MAG: hypothetical protein LCDPAC01_01380 [Pithovirus LCDPAC01]